MAKKRYRTPELEVLLLEKIARSQPDMMATTDDVLQLGMVYVADMFGERDDKVLGDTIRWALIYMCDTMNWLSRPFGKQDQPTSRHANTEWIRANRPTQDTRQTVWQLTAIGQLYLRSTSAKLQHITQTVSADLDALTHEESPPNVSREGKKRHNFTSYYERNPTLRATAIAYYGTVCQICKFDFEATYGEHGAGYIEVHHLRPLSSYEGEIFVNPIDDLLPVCSNCHRMIHRKKDHVLSPEELKHMLDNQ